MSVTAADEGWADTLAEVRERLARLETQADAHDRAGAERHQQVLASMGVLQARLGQVEARSWRLALALSLVGVGGGAGGLGLLQFLVG